MRETDLLIIGSGPAAVSAAQGYRNNDGKGRVLLVTADSHAPYMRPPLSKDLLQGDSGPGEIDLHPQEWFDEKDIEVLTGTEVTSLDPEGRSVMTADGSDISYRHLVIATGASPSPLPVPGGDTALTLRSLADALALRDAADGATSAVVVGAGFIGCEAAASLAARGISTTVVAPEPSPQSSRLGSDAGSHFAALLEQAGVRYSAGAQVESVSDGSVRLDSGVTIDVDLVVAAVGITPNSKLADDAGITLDNGRIVVDSSMRTSAPDIYAAGDVATAFNDTAGRHIATEHWQDADDQGAVAGTAAAGVRAHWDSVPGFWTTIGDRTVKYAAWGDGYDRTHHSDHGTDGPGESFTIWYLDADGITVGALTLDRDDDYEAATSLIEEGKPAPI